MSTFHDHRLGELAALAARLGATMQTDPAQMPAEEYTIPLAQQTVPPTTLGQLGPNGLVAPQNGLVSPQQYGRQWSEDEVNAERERIRKEERDKLHSRLTEAERKSKEFAELEMARRDAEQQAETDRQAAEQARQMAEADAAGKISLLQQQYDQRFAQIEQERALERATYEREQEYQNLERYKVEALRANAESILPQFQDPAFLYGNSETEVNVSLQRLVERSAATLAEISGVQQGALQGAPGVSPRAPGMSPDDFVPTNQRFTAEQLAAMPMSQYQQIRHLLPTGRPQGGQGLLG